MVEPPTPLKNDGVRQLGWWFPTEWERSPIHVPNHQPVYKWFIFAMSNHRWVLPARWNPAISQGRTVWSGAFFSGWSCKETWRQLWHQGSLWACHGMPSSYFMRVISINNDWLVVLAITILKNLGVRQWVLDDIPYMKWNIIQMFETTNQMRIEWDFNMV